MRSMTYRSYWRADGVGFEPTVRANVRQFSRLVPSTTRPPIRIVLVPLIAKAPTMWRQDSTTTCQTRKSHRKCPRSPQVGHPDRVRGWIEPKVAKEAKSKSNLLSALASRYSHSPAVRLPFVNRWLDDLWLGNLWNWQSESRHIRLGHIPQVRLSILSTVTSDDRL
jgi:hypothetical protein